MNTPVVLCSRVMKFPEPDRLVRDANWYFIPHRYGFPIGPNPNDSSYRIVSIGLVGISRRYRPHGSRSGYVDVVRPLASFLTNLLIDDVLERHPYQTDEQQPINQSNL